MGASISVNHRGGGGGGGGDERQTREQAATYKERLLVIQERGVLIPPAFGVVGSGSGSGECFRVAAGSMASSRGGSLSVHDATCSSSSSGGGRGGGNFLNPRPWQQTCRQDTPSHGLLYDYMQPGLWAKTVDSAGNVSVLASLITTTTATTTSASTTTTASTVSSSRGHSSDASPGASQSQSVVLGRIVGERYWWDRQIMTSIRGGASGLGTTAGEGGEQEDDATSLTARLQLSPGVSLWACGNINGDGWLSSNLNYTYHNNNNNNSTKNNNNNNNNSINLELISWISFCSNNKSSTTNNNQFSNNNSTRVVWGDLHTFGALRVANQLTAATEALISLDHHTTTGGASSSSLLDAFSNVKSYCSVDLLTSGGSQLSSSSSTTDSSSSPLPSPPLQLALERSSPTSSALSLSQVISFDRLQFNPTEDRAPFVRNTAAWTIRLENTTTTSAAAMTTEDDSNNRTTTTAPLSSSTPLSTTTDIAVGAAWQINRAVAVKAVLRPMRKSLTGALLLKRWRQPRLTCSILGRYSWQPDSNAVCSFLGVGLELETTTTTTATSGQRGHSGNKDHYDYYPTSAWPAGIEAPETKATLP